MDHIICRPKISSANKELKHVNIQVDFNTELAVKIKIVNVTFQCFGSVLYMVVGDIDVFSVFLYVEVAA